MINQYAKYLILLMLVGASACFAATPFTPRYPDAVHESWRWRSFPELKGQRASCLAQDGDGNFLFGTGDGIYRYDGINWRLYPFDEGMVGAQINALYVARDGRVYVGSDRGISRFENGMWERVFPLQGDKWNTYDLMEAKDGSLWAGTEWGALRLTLDGVRLYVAAEDTTGIREMVSDAVTFVAVPLSRQRLMVYDVCEAPDGAIWFGDLHGDLIRFTLDGVYQRFDGEIDQGVYPRLCVTKDGVVWVVYGDKSKSVNRFAGERWEALEVGEVGNSHHYTSILESRDGTLWIGGSRLIAYRDGVWRVYDSKDIVSLPLHCTELFEAADGALWIIEREQEASRLDLSENYFQTYDGLIFQCDTDGAQWFISQDNGVVRRDGQGWTRFGVEDGLMDMPSKLIVTREGALWAVGSHERVAATARLDGSEWVMKRHPQLSWGVDPRGVYEAFDGTLWFVSAVDWWLYDGFLGGVVVFDGASWTHHTPPMMTRYAYGIGQSSDGVLWFGGRLFGFDGVREVQFTGPEILTNDFIDAVYTRGNLWLGSRTYGVFRHNGTEWHQFDYQDGLADNRVSSIFQDRAGAIWVRTAKGVSRFDGRTWLPQALPSGLPRTEFYDPILQSGDGALWLNSVSDVDAWLRRSESEGVAVSWTLRTIRYVPETDPPETIMTIDPDEVSEGGEITFAWTGIDAYRSTLREDLQYAHRLNGGEWSPYGGDTILSFEGLDVGTHTVEVKARDLAFNEDPTPIVMSFNVVPLVWRRLWFISLIVGFVILTGYLISRIIVRDRRLQKANEDLASANETQLLQSARLVSLGQMVAGVAHELNQPLTAVETSAGDICLRLKEGMPLETDELREMMEDVRGVVDRMAGTVDHLRVFSRDVSEEPRQAMDVNAVIQSSLKLMGSQLENHGIDLALDLSDALPKVWGHLHPLEQVVLNLLSNARDAVDERTEMEGVGYDKEVYIRTRVEGDAVVIEVEDNGVGMDEATRQRLFEPFFTTKDADRGTGLGLSITYAIVRNHDGQIAVESEQGTGTMFKVMLPVLE